MAHLKLTVQYWWLVVAPEGTQLPAKYASLVVASSQLNIRPSFSAIAHARSLCDLPQFNNSGAARVRPATPDVTAILKVKGQSTQCEYGGLRNMAATGEWEVLVVYRSSLPQCSSRIHREPVCGVSPQSSRRREGVRVLWHQVPRGREV